MNDTRQFDDARARFFGGLALNEDGRLVDREHLEDIDDLKEAFRNEEANRPRRRGGLIAVVVVCLVVVIVIG